MGKKKQEKKKKLGTKKEKRIQFNANFWIGIFILITMVLSIGGFAMISGGPNAGAKYKTQQDVPLQYLNKYGVWATVKNNQEFIFSNIDQYNNMTNIDSLASKIRVKNNINLFVDPNFDPSSSLIIEKALKAISIPTKILTNPNCNKDNNLILTNNRSIQGNCMLFIGNNSGNQTYQKANALVYYLIK